jgi:hypothetical protein
MKTIHVVTFVSGCRCCDRFEKTLRAFEEERDAENFRDHEYVRLGREIGKRDALNAMIEEWYKSNPRPESPEEEAHNVVREQYRRATDAWHVLRDEEEARLIKILGDIEPLVRHSWDEDFRLHIEEVAFGWPKKEETKIETTEEVH